MRLLLSLSLQQQAGSEQRDAERGGFGDGDDQIDGPVAIARGAGDGAEGDAVGVAAEGQEVGAEREVVEGAGDGGWVGGFGAGEFAGEVEGSALRAGGVGQRHLVIKQQVKTRRR